MNAAVSGMWRRPMFTPLCEVGINASFLDRFDLELVKSDRHTEDAFLQVPLSLAQSGGFTSQWQNAARIGGRTFEGSLNTRVIDRPDFSYNFTLTGERSRQKIDELNRARAGAPASGYLAPPRLITRANVPNGDVFEPPGGYRATARFSVSALSASASRSSSAPGP